MRIFIVEDDPIYGDMLSYHLDRNPEYEILKFETAKEVLNNIYLQPDIITIDYSLPDMKGDELLKTLKKKLPDVPVIVVSSQQKINTAVDLLKLGAFDYILKDEDTFEKVWKGVRLASRNASLKEEIVNLKAEIIEKYDFSNTIKGDSPALKKVFRIMEKASRTDINVSVYGETGTGKELVAKSIHYNSGRAKKPFIAVNMAAIPRELIESELFGHEKGAFTGANARRVGKFEEASGGTIFLDEIGELELNLQAKLLRVLQESEVTRVGSNTPVKINCRIITATHRNITEQIKDGLFREDLYYRIKGLPVNLPPLRERGNDIVLLANYFLEEFSERNSLGKMVISKEAKAKLIKYGFPGNIRELRSIIELSAVMAEDGIIADEDITFDINDGVSNFLHEEKSLKEYTSEIIHHFLKKYDNNVLLVADKLNVGKSTIYQMLKEERSEAI